MFGNENSSLFEVVQVGLVFFKLQNHLYVVLLLVQAWFKLGSKILMKANTGPSYFKLA
jgi:hypothetical protein